MSKNGLNGFKLGFGTCAAIIIGGCIGSAIYSLSGLTMYYAGPSSLLSWLIAGIIMAAYGMIVSELAVRYPVSGGAFSFPQLVFGEANPVLGDVLGFASAWGAAVSSVIAVAFAAIYVPIYLTAGFPSIKVSSFVIALVAIVFCLMLNLMKVTGSGKINNILVALLALSMLVFSCVAVFGGTFDFSNFIPFFTQGAKGSTGFITAIPVALVAYGSCTSISYMVGDVENPKRNIPLSLFVGLAVVAILYLFVIFATAGNLKSSVLVENPGLRYIPMYAAVYAGSLSVFPWLGKVVSISAVLAILTTMNVVMAFTSRTIKAMADRNCLPSFLSKENKNSVPAAAAGLIAFFAALLSYFPDKTGILVSLGAMFSVISMIVTCLSLIEARRKNQTMSLLYRTPGGNILPILAIAILFACYLPDVISGSFKLILFTFIVFAAGYLIMYLCGREGKAGKKLASN